MGLNSTPQNQFEVAYPSYVFLKAFGLFSHSFDGDVRRGNLILRVRDVIQLIIYLTFYLTLASISTIKQGNTDLNVSKMLDAAWRVISVVSTVVVMILISHSAWKWKSYVLFIELCCKFDLRVCYILFINLHNLTQFICRPKNSRSS